MLTGDLIRGAFVRVGRRRGRIHSVYLPWVNIEWEDGRKTSYRRGDAGIMDSAEVLTTSGWVPMGDLLGSRSYLLKRTQNRKDTQMEFIEAIRARYQELVEKSPHSPFKRKSVLGPTGTPKTAVGGVPKKTRAVRKTGEYTCKCQNYKCKCNGPEGEKTITIRRQYKGNYNKAYSRWVASRNKMNKGKARSKKTVRSRAG